MTQNTPKLITVIKNGERITVRKKDLMEYVDDTVEDNIFYGYKTQRSEEEIDQYEEEAVRYKKALRAAMNAGITEFEWDAPKDLPAVDGFVW